MPPVLPPTKPKLRPLTEADHADVLALNHDNVEALAPLDAARLTQLRGWAHRADVVDVEGGFGGFVLTFAPGTAYDSDNYHWFGDRYGEHFYYLDRIVLHPAFRRRGLGGFVYDEMERAATPYRRMVLEVNVEPRNDASLAFHAARGYTEVGRLGGPGKLVSLMVKELR